MIGTGAWGRLVGLDGTTTIVDVTVVGTLLGADDGTTVEISVVDGQVVTVVRVKVLVRVTGLVYTEDCEVKVV